MVKQICYKFDDQRRPRKANNKFNQSYYLNRIPNEVITSVLARVASSSIADLSNAKLSCKVLRSICDDGYVLKHATLDKVPVIPWPMSQILFVELCKKNGNPEALYRKGVVDYFGGGNKDYALECLKMAKECGHLGASYAIGVILLLTGEKQRGIQHLGTMKKDKKFIKDVTECRNKLKRIIGCMWKIHNDQIVKDIPTCCSSKYQHVYRRGWCLEDDEKHIECEACLCDIEVDCIYDSLRCKIM